MSTTEVAPDPTEVLDSKVQPVFYEIGPAPEEDEPSAKQVFIQKELTFFGKIDFFSVMAKAIEKALNEGVSVSELLDVPDREEGQPINLDSLAEADAFIKAVAQLVAYSEDLLLDLYCVILAVPRKEREEAKELFEQYMTDEQGFKVLEVFVDQNWDVMVSFFSERITPLVHKVGQRVQVSAPSKPSKTTRRRTPKASTN